MLRTDTWRSPHRVVTPSVAVTALGYALTTELFSSPYTVCLDPSALYQTPHALPYNVLERRLRW